MGSRLTRHTKETTKSKIKEKREEISRSMNELEQISSNLKIDNEFLLNELNKKKLFIETLNSDIDDIKGKTKKAKEQYAKLESEYKDLNSKYYNLYQDYNNKVLALKTIEENYKNEFIKKDKQLQSKQISLDKQIKIQEDKLEDIKLKNEGLKLENNRLSCINEDLNKNILSNKKVLKECENNINEYEENIKKIKDEYIENKVKKNLLEASIKELEDNQKKAKLKIKGLNSEIELKNTELVNMSKKIEESRILNLSLVNEKERLNKLKTNLQRIADKVGYNINL